jgi:hypothetical protein
MDELASSQAGTVRDCIKTIIKNVVNGLCARKALTSSKRETEVDRWNDFEIVPLVLRYPLDYI